MTERLRYDLEVEVDPMDPVSSIDSSSVCRSIRGVMRAYLPSLRVARLAVVKSKQPTIGENK